MDSTKKNRLLADDAARLYLDNGYLDYEKAKLKARKQRYAHNSSNSLPKNRDIHRAILERRATFNPSPSNLEEHCLIVLEAVLPSLAAYPYKITGSVFDGSYADSRPRIEIHLHADTVEEVLFDLEQGGIEGDLHERVIRYGKKKTQMPLSVIRLFTEMVQVDMLILPVKFHAKPINPATGMAYEYIHSPL